jgi:hypothetical protein
VSVTGVDQQMMSKECQDQPFSLPSPEQDVINHVEEEVTAVPAKRAVDSGQTVCGVVQQEEHMIDFVKFGWDKSIRILINVVKFVRKLQHKRHADNADNTCIYCPQDGQVIIQTQELVRQVEHMVFRMESDVVKKELPRDALKQMEEVEGVLYYSGRLDDNNPLLICDIDFNIALDNTDFTTCIPVVRANSQVFFAYLLNVHTRIRPHAGVESTVRELLKKMFVWGKFRHVVRKVRADCTRCRIISRKTVELELSKHHYTRTLIAPVFYTVQMDIVYGFTAKLYKGARKTAKLYALAIVCLHTSATNILAIERIDTQTVVNALERHGCRFGMPAEVYVDNGSQLAKLDSYSFAIRDIDAQLYDARSVRVFLSTPKAHNERGRVENKVKALRDMLEKHSVSEKYPLTPLEWETTFARIANTLNDIPIAKGNSSNVSDLGFDVLTPNKLIMGRNNFRSLQGAGRLLDPTVPSELLDRNRKIMSMFFEIMVDRLHHLQTKPNKWSSSSPRQPVVDDIVVFKFNESNSVCDWKLGRVVSVEPRKVSIAYTTKLDPKSIPVLKFLERSPRDVVIVLSEKEMAVNSSEYFTSISA